MGRQIGDELNHFTSGLKQLQHELATFNKLAVGAATDPTDRFGEVMTPFANAATQQVGLRTLHAHVSPVRVPRTFPPPFLRARVPCACPCMPMPAHARAARGPPHGGGRDRAAVEAPLPIV